MDIKHIDNEKCIDLTGLPNTNTLNFATYLSEIPLLEMAKERPINVFIGYQPCKDIVKPQLKVDGNNVTIMMNY